MKQIILCIEIKNLLAKKELHQTKIISHLLC